MEFFLLEMNLGIVNVLLFHEEEQRKSDTTPDPLA